MSPLLPLNSPLLSQDSNLSLHTDNPDFTPCFQNSVLAWVPCAYLWAALPCYLLYLRRHHEGYIVLSHLSRLKTVRGSGLSCGWDWNVNESLLPPSVTGLGSPASPALCSGPASWVYSPKR